MKSCKHDERFKKTPLKVGVWQVQCVIVEHTVVFFIEQVFSVNKLSKMLIKYNIELFQGTPKKNQKPKVFY